MKSEKEWFCIECGEKLNTNYYGEECFGQCICENCFTINDIVEDGELQHDGLEKALERMDNDGKGKNGRQ